MTSVLEDGTPHRPIELLFDAAEESYCTGIQKFDFSRLRAKTAYVFDLSGPVGNAAYQAPSIVSFRAEFTGRAAHAAFSPEEGLHAIKAAAEAVSRIDCGRVGDLTVNVGTITGGTADNIVPETCVLTGEVRGFVRRWCCRSWRKSKKPSGRQPDDSASGPTPAETFCQAYRQTRRTGHWQLPRSLRGGRAGKQSDRNLRRQRQQPFLPARTDRPCCRARYECLPQLYTSADELTRAARLAEALIVSRK